VGREESVNRWNRGYDGDGEGLVVIGMHMKFGRREVKVEDLGVQ
jgi:hypothetical protein